MVGIRALAHQYYHASHITRPLVYVVELVGRDIGWHERRNGQRESPIEELQLKPDKVIVSMQTKRGNELA
jgi:hypothetical protein